MKNWKVGLFLILAGFVQSYSAIGQTAKGSRQPTIQGQTSLPPKIFHDPDADFKQRRGLIHNRTYLTKKLAPFHLNVDSLQNVVDNLNQSTKDKEWEYQLSTMKSAEGKILKFYKSHYNADGSKGHTTYGQEKRRQPDR